MNRVKCVCVCVLVKPIGPQLYLVIQEYAVANTFRGLLDRKILETIQETSNESTKSEN